MTEQEIVRQASRYRAIQLEELRHALQGLTPGGANWHELMQDIVEQLLLCEISRLNSIAFNFGHAVEK